MSLYIDDNFGSSGNAFKLGIYDTSGNLLGETEAGAVPSSHYEGWQTCNFTTPLFLPAGDYVLAAISNFGGWDMRYSAGSTGQGYRDTASTWPTFDDPASFGSEDRAYSIYATYIPNPYEITNVGSTLEFDTADGNVPNIGIIDETHFVMSWEGSGSDGYIATFSIDEDYNITKINELEFDTDTGRLPALGMLDSTHPVVAYTGEGTDGYVKTFSIDGSYNITLIDTLEFDTDFGFYCGIQVINSSHFIVAHYGTSAALTIRTFSVDGSFDNITVLDTETSVAIGTGNPSRIVGLSATKFIVASINSGSDIELVSLTIDGSYNITLVDNLQVAITGTGAQVSLLALDETHFAIAYTIGTDDYTVSIYSVDSSNDNITLVDTFTDASDRCGYSSMQKTDDRAFILARQDVGSLGVANIFTYDDSYNLTEQEDGVFEPSVMSGYSSVKLIDESHAVIAFEGASGDGFVCIVQIGENEPEVYSESVDASIVGSAQANHPPVIVNTRQITDKTTNSVSAEGKIIKTGI
jgi:hypothetical protein